MAGSSFLKPQPQIACDSQGPQHLRAPPGRAPAVCFVMRLGLLSATVMCGKYLFRTETWGFLLHKPFHGYLCNRPTVSAYQWKPLMSSRRSFSQSLRGTHFQTLPRVLSMFLKRPRLVKLGAPAAEAALPRRFMRTLTSLGMDDRERWHRVQLWGAVLS